MKAYKIVISDYYYPDLDEEMKVFGRLGGGVRIVDCTKLAAGGIMEPTALIPHVRDADALITQFARVTPEVFASMEKCRVVARYAIGVDTIDIEAARSRGVHVANVPDYCLDEVSDTAAAHILSSARQIGRARDLLLRGDFTMDALAPAHRLKDSTLTLLGFGNIARNLAEKMRPFFAKILAYDPYFNETAKYPYVRFVGFDEALAAGDVVSVHLPLNDETRGMLDADAFGKMKPGAIFVNTARGGLVDEKALIAALDCGPLSFAGLDVIPDEDFASSPLLSHPKVCLTPHIAWRGEEARRELQRKTAENVVETLLSGKPKYCVC